MTKVVLDAAVLAKLGNLEDLVEFCDESGRTIGYFRPVVWSLKDLSPFSDEEVEELRKQTGGRPLKDILADLQKR